MAALATWRLPRQPVPLRARSPAPPPPADISRRTDRRAPEEIQREERSGRTNSPGSHRSRAPLPLLPPALAAVTGSRRCAVRTAYDRAGRLPSAVNWMPAPRGVLLVSIAHSADLKLPGAGLVVTPAVSAVVLAAGLSGQRPVMRSMASGYRAPCTGFSAAPRPISRKSSAVSAIAAAPTFSSRRASFVVPGIGTIHGL